VNADGLREGVGISTDDNGDVNFSEYHNGLRNGVVKIFKKMEKSTGGKLKMIISKAMHKKYILMERPTMVNIIMVKEMVIQL